MSQGVEEVLNFSGGVPQGVFIELFSFLQATTASHAESICKFNLVLISLSGLFISADRQRRMLICGPWRLCFQCDLLRDQSLKLPVVQQQGHCQFSGLFYFETKTKEGSLLRFGGMAHFKKPLALDHGILLVRGG